MTTLEVFPAAVHSGRHAAGGADPLAPSDIGAVAGLTSAAVITTAATPVAGQKNRYSAAAGNLAPTLPALSGLSAGPAEYHVEKTGTDTSPNTVTLTCAGSDLFEDGATTTKQLAAPTEFAVLVVVSIAGVKRWAVKYQGVSRAQADVRFQSRSALRRRDFTGNPLTVMASPPTVTTSAIGASNTAGLTKQISFNEPGRFTYLGAPPVLYTGTPNGYAAWSSSDTFAGPWGLEFNLDTTGGSVELRLSQGHGRIAVDGQLVSAAQSFSFNNAANYQNVLISGLAAGVRRIRIELSNNDRFSGAWIAPTDAIRPATPAPVNMVVFGDSFVLPTITDTASDVGVWHGFVQQLAEITGYNVWSAGYGGTGYLNPGSATKFRTRLPSVLATNPDVLLITGGTNDYAYSGYSYAAFYAEALALLQLAKASMPGPNQVIVAAPFTSLGGADKVLGPLWDLNDALKAAALAAGVPFLDFFAPPADQPLSNTLSAASTVGATLVQTATNTAIEGGSFFTFNYPVWIKIGTGPTQERRLVTGFSGSGPYSLVFTGKPLLYAHAAGDPVVRAAATYLTGTGNQSGTPGPQGDGDSDRYIGSDGHPTVAGHLMLAYLMARQLQKILPA